MEDRIKNIMAVIFEVFADDLKDESSPNSIKLWDSLKHMQLVVALEEEFNVQFTDDEILGLQNYSVIKETISKKVSTIVK